MLTALAQCAVPKRQLPRQGVARLPTGNIPFGKVGQAGQDKPHDRKNQPLEGNRGDEEHHAQPQHQ